MELRRISVSNFANIAHAEIDLADITALVAPNNYGKSNVLQAVRFAADFISASPKEKSAMMRHPSYAPFNEAIGDGSFEFEMDGVLADGSEFCYYFSFRWGGEIAGERLGIRTEESQRYTRLIERSSSAKAKYLGTPEGRCSKNLEIASDALALNKLSNFDSLFYVGSLREIEDVKIRAVDTLTNPDTYFVMNSQARNREGYSTAFPDVASAAYFIYSLKMKAPDSYEVLCDAVRQLLPNVEKIEAVEISLDAEKGERLYDVRVKERNNSGTTSISRVSSGSKKIVYLLAMTIAAQINGISLLVFEELENSVHPRLLQSLLMILQSLAGESKILTTSHSPYFIKYLNPRQIYLGMPDAFNLADFRKLRESKIRKIMKLASDEEISLGEYLFEMMLDMQQDDEVLNKYFQ